MTVVASSELTRVSDGFSPKNVIDRMVIHCVTKIPFILIPYVGLYAVQQVRKTDK